MKKLLKLDGAQILNGKQQKAVLGGGPYDDPCNPNWQTCCSNNDDCMDPYSEDNGYSYSVCEGNYCVEYYY